MERKLIKEIITTETEKFSEDGIVKERIKETREKIYADEREYTKEEIAEATPVVEEKVEEKPKEKAQEELVREAAAALEKQRVENQQLQPQQTNPGGYNVINRSTPQPMGPYNPNGAAKFPWET